jgi:hypothetical protein
MIQVADGGLQRAQQVDRHGPRGLLGLIGGDIHAELTDPGFSVFPRDMAR